MDEHRTTTSMETMALNFPGAVDRGIKAIIQGEMVITQLANNFGYLANPANDRVVTQILNAKHNPNAERPFSVILQTKVFTDMIDYQRVPQALHELLKDPKQLEERLGLMCHLRAPITLEAAASLPSHILSWQEGVPYIQNFFITGHLVLEALRDRLYEEQGLYLSVTTINQHGTPEITTLAEAKDEASQTGVSLLLTDEPKRPEVKGSWPIIDIENLTAVRDGCVPISTIRLLLGTNISTEGMTKSKHVQDEAFLAYLTWIEDLEIDPKVIRRIILSYLSGADLYTALQQVMIP